MQSSCRSVAILELGPFVPSVRADGTCGSRVRLHIYCLNVFTAICLQRQKEPNMTAARRSEQEIPELYVVMRGE